MSDIVSAMGDRRLFEPWFRGPTWDGWRSVLKGAFALPMNTAELEFFRQVAEREPPKKRVRELSTIASSDQAAGCGLRQVDGFQSTRRASSDNDPHSHRPAPSKLVDDNLLGAAFLNGQDPKPTIGRAQTAP
jgi:hypothetical protein